MQGRPLGCRFVKHNSEEEAAAAGVDATLWHAPTFCWVNQRPEGSKHMRVVASTESPVYYNCLDHRGFMSQFDIEMTYRMCSQVPLHYFVDSYASLDEAGLLQPPLPFDAKANAVAVVASNCQNEGAFSGRTRILRELIAVAARRNSTIKVLSYGNCERNTPFPANSSKLALIALHKFCFAMENSIAQDYVTEKVGG